MSKRPVFLAFFVPVLLIIAQFAAVSCVDNVGPPVDPNGGEDSTGSGERPIFLGKPPVLINEINPFNADYKDEYGNTPGWVEVFNPADTAVSLGGYYLTSSVNRRMWSFGDVVVAPRGYLVVFMSGKDKPDYVPADSINLLASAVGAWDWSDDRAAPIAGRSTAEQVFVANTSISGSLVAVDNQRLGWTSAVVMLVLKDWDTTAVVDMSEVGQIQFRGFISKNSRLEVRLPHVGVADWQAWPTVLAGTGVEHDLYTIALPSNISDFPDLKHIYGLRFANPPNYRGSIDFTFNSIVAKKRGGNVHASFELGMGGGRLFLMDSDGHIRDSLAYPGGTRGLSYARNESGGWAFSKPPTPNAANSVEVYEGQVEPPPAASIPASGYYENLLTFTLPHGTNGGVICCDTTGRLPTKESELRSGVTLSFTQTGIMRCAQFKDGAYASEAVMRTYIINDNISGEMGKRMPSLPVVSIAVDPVDMFDQTVGLYMRGPNASSAQPYFGANYWLDTELPIQIEFFENGVKHAWTNPAGLRIFGNWSRMFAKKSILISFRDRYGQKNLRYPLFPEYPKLTKFKHFILRNNGNNFDQDYIRDMLMSSLTEGTDIDYQKGRAVIVYYNGRYFGIHNMRERTNSDYFETNYDIDEDYIDLVKANNEVSRGSDADYQNIMRWLESVTLTDENLEELDRRVDVGNFTTHYQCRMYYNDRDWPGNNMKRWRSNSPPSRWRFLMYDTDHGWGSYGSGHRPDLTMFQFITVPNGPDWPNPPHSTFLLRKLLTNESYKNAFINTWSLLVATYFDPARVDARIDALMTPIQSEIPIDQARWGHNALTMNNQFNIIRNFGQTRPNQSRRELEQFFGLDGGVDFTVSANGNGNIFVHHLQVMNAGSGVTFKAYASVPMVVKAVPNPGAVFNGWSDGVGGAERIITAEEAMALEARFGPAAF
jgi:hypothetical protein